MQDTGHGDESSRLFKLPVLYSHPACAQYVTEEPKDWETKRQKDSSCTSNPKFRTTTVLRNRSAKNYA